MSAKISRRTFLIRTAAGIGAATLACSGLTVVGMQPRLNPAYESLVSGETAVNKKVLVTYASKAGSTMEVAQSIAKDLTDRGFAVDIRPVKQVAGVDGYSAVVHGSAIRMGNVLPEVVKFVETNAAALKKIPTAYFALYLMNQGEDEANRKARGAYLDALRKLVSPSHEALFTGVGDMSKVSFIEGLIGKMVKSPEGDFRDWKAISTWSQAIFA